jgi:hypothetical protein
MSAVSDLRCVIDATKEVTKMLRDFSARRLLAVGLVMGALAAAAPAASLASNGGGGPGQPVHQVGK